MAGYKKKLLTLQKIIHTSKRAKRLHDDYLEIKYLDTTKHLIDLAISAEKGQRRKDLKKDLLSYVTGIPRSEEQDRRSREGEYGVYYGGQTYDHPFSPNKRERNKINKILKTDLTKDIVSNYYASLDAANSQELIYNSIITSSRAVNPKLNKSGMSALKRLIDDYDFKNRKITTVGPQGEIEELTAGERRILKTNRAIARGITNVLEHATYRTVKGTINFLFNVLVPQDKREKYHRNRNMYMTNIPHGDSVDFVNDIKGLGDEASKNSWKAMTKFHSGMVETAGDHGGINADEFKRWYHNYDDDYILYIYDMTYGFHFGYLEERKLPFDICDIYSGQFVESHPEHPTLEFNNKLDDVDESMYDWNSSLIYNLYIKDAETYNRMGTRRRHRTFRSLNYPRGGSPRYSIIITMPDLVRSLIDNSGLDVGDFKNVYEESQLPRDHANGFCIVSAMSLRKFLKHHGVVIEPPEPEDDPVEFMKERMSNMFATVVTDFIWSKRDEKGNLIGIRGFRKGLEEGIERRLLGMQKGFLWRDAVTLDRKIKDISMRLRFGEGRLDNDVAFMVNEATQQFYGTYGETIIKPDGTKYVVTNLRNRNGDSMGVFINDKTLRRRKGTNIVRRKAVIRREKTYTTVDGDRSPAGDLIIYTKNIEHMIKHGLKSDVLDQIAMGVSEQFLSASHINRFGKPKKRKIVGAFRAKLNELRRDKADVLKVNHSVKKTVNMFHKAKTVNEQLKAVAFLLTKDPDIFGDLFGATFNFIRKEAEEMLNERIYLSIIKKAGL
jgi:hypothetical protein